MRVAGAERWLAIEDAGRVRDALGAALPVGIPEAFTELMRDPLGDLVARYARTHGPFHAEQVGLRLGLGVAVVNAALDRLREAGRVMAGEFRPGGQGSEWCDAEVLRTIRRRSLAALRREVEPVSTQTLARFTPAWQGLTARNPARGVAGLARAIEQLAGAPIAASALESMVLPARVADYSPALLDQLTLSGDVVGGAPARSVRPTAGSCWRRPTPPNCCCRGGRDHLDPNARSDRRRAGRRSGPLFRALADHAPGTDDEAVVAIWDLLWSGRITNDTLGPIRTLNAAAPRRNPTRPTGAARPRFGRYTGLSGVTGLGSAAGLGSDVPTRSVLRAAPNGMAGRWSQLPERNLNPTTRALAAAEVMLDRYGVVTRGAVAAERWPGGFSAPYRCSKRPRSVGEYGAATSSTDSGAAQFALPGAIERLRGLSPTSGKSSSSGDATPTLVLAATDPANPYGAVLPWPAPMASVEGLGEEPSSPRRRGHQPARKAGALVVLVDGACVLYVERGGRTLLSFTDDVAVLQPAADALALIVRDGVLGRARRSSEPTVPRS